MDSTNITKKLVIKLKTQGYNTACINKLYLFELRNIILDLKGPRKASLTKTYRWSQVTESDHC